MNYRIQVGTVGNTQATVLDSTEAVSNARQVAKIFAATFDDPVYIWQSTIYGWRGFEVYRMTLQGVRKRPIAHDKYPEWIER